MGRRWVEPQMTGKAPAPSALRVGCDWRPAACVGPLARTSWDKIYNMRLHHPPQYLT